MTENGSLPEATAEQPLPIVVSACLLGHEVGYDGSSWPHDVIGRICALPNVEAHAFCPENHTLGTPRRWMSIHGGDGHAVLRGDARVVNVDGADLSDPFRAGAAELLRIAQGAGARIALLTEISPMCGGTVIYRGEGLPERVYRAAPGVGAALLREHGVRVVASRDHATLGRLLAHLDPGFDPDPNAIDYVDDPWFQEHLV